MSTSPHRKAILVNGPPASGKTTIAEALAAHFHLPILARDAVQEALYDTLGTGNREYNRLLGRAGMAVIWRMLQHFPHDAVVIIDTWCRYPPFDWLTDWIEVRRHHPLRGGLLLGAGGAPCTALPQPRRRAPSQSSG